MLAILVCIFASCSDGGSDNPVNPTPKPEEVKTEITIDSGIVSNGLSFGVAEGEQSVSFSVNANWTLSIASTTSGATWCKASVTSGNKGTTNVKFTVEENTGYDDRSVSVTIKAGSVSKTFTITQKGVDALLLTTTKYEVPQEGGQIEIEVKANIDYQMEISKEDKSWITEVSSRTLTTYRHKLNIALNEDAVVRDGKITFKSGDKVETVKVYQAGGAIILLSQNEYAVSDAGDTISVDIKSNIDFGVQMPDVDWVINEASSRGMSSHTLKYIITANEGYDSRSADIIFYDKNSDLKDTLKVVQAQKDAILVPKNEYTIDAIGGDLKFKVNTNVDFEVSVPVDWIEQNIESRGLEARTLSFTIAENIADYSRETYISFIYGNIKQNIRIIQEGKDRTPYVTFTADEEQTLKMSKIISTLEFSVNGGKWNELGKTIITFGGVNGKLRLRGRSAKGTETARIIFGNKDVFVSCTGDIRTLVDYRYYATIATNSATFQYLFKDCANLTTPPQLPSMSLAKNCYSQMFYGCSNLTIAPELPATTLAEECYWYMFADCKNLISPPELPATTLSKACYAHMFNGCTNLRSTPKLPATKLAHFCYSSMFAGCNNLTSAPELPAKEMMSDCYRGMFQGCSSLTSPPKLPAIDLYEYCYFSMFQGCSKLMFAPELPATKLARHCYAYMFDGCSDLTIAPKLPATTLVESCYRSMFKDCISLVKSPILSASILVESCYEHMFNGCSNLNEVTMLAIDASAVNSLAFWLDNVASTGIFIKNAIMDVSQLYIPIGWTIVSYNE